LAVCLPALIQALEITIGDYELAPRELVVPARTRIVSREMANGDFEHVEETVEAEELDEETEDTIQPTELEAREDKANDRMAKWTQVFTEFLTTSRLFKQCTVTDSTVKSMFLYYANPALKFTSVRFTPKAGIDKVKFKRIRGNTDYSTCITKAAEGNYAMAQYYYWSSWFWTSGYSCKASTTYYALTDGQKCTRKRYPSLFLINKTS